MFRMTYNQANIRGGILVTCSCNFVYGLQVVSTKELQRTLAIRSLNGRSSKRKGKGISEARKWTGNQSTLCLDARSARRRGRRRFDYEQSLFFLSPSSEMIEKRKWPH